MAGGPLQAADDMVRIISNGLTFGAADKIAAALGEKDTASKTAAARQRAGFAGDVGSILGLGGGVKLAFQGLKGAAKAAPAVGRAVLSKKGAAAGALGLGSLVEYNTRNSSQAATPAKPKAQTKPAGAKPRNTANADKIADGIMSSLKAADGTPLTFEQMAQSVAEANGGISLRQLGALAEVTQRTTPKAAKVPRPQDTAIARLQSYYDGLHEAEIASGVPQAQADANWAGRYEGLAKMNPLDQLIRNSDQDEAE